MSKTSTYLLITALVILVAVLSGFWSWRRGPGETHIYPERSPAIFDTVVALVQHGDSDLFVVISTTPENTTYELHLQGIPDQRWPGSGYAVYIREAGQREQFVMSPGQETIGLDDATLDQLLSEAARANQSAPCRIAVLDLRNFAGGPRMPHCP